MPERCCIMKCAPTGVSLLEKPSPDIESKILLGDSETTFHLALIAS